MDKLKVLTVIGTRPEIIRLSRVIAALDRECERVLVHTGQNYDYELNEIFFNDLDIRKPDHFLEAAGATAAETIGQVIARADRVLQTVAPPAFLVLGDTNSCLAAIAAKHRKIPVFHMEAGNRCFDQRVPEEINRVLVDHISDITCPTDGTVVAWGWNNYGQTNIPAGLTNVVVIAAGDYHNLALPASGEVVAWGWNASGQTNVPANLTNAVAIAAGGYHSLAIINDGSPWIVTQPLSQTVASNSTVQFAVTALGQPALAYQWQKNGGNLTDSGNVSGSASATLTLSNVQTADMAVYSVLITNAIGQTASAPATLLVLGPPLITLQPVSQTVNGGTTAQFTIAAMGSPSPAYQWWWNGTNLAGFGASLTLTNTTRAVEGIYSVLVTNGIGGVFSSNAVLRVLVPQQLGKPMLLPNGALQFTSSDVGGGALPPADLSGFEARPAPT